MKLDQFRKKHDFEKKRKVHKDKFDEECDC